MDSSFIINHIFYHCNDIIEFSVYNKNSKLGEMIDK